MRQFPLLEKGNTPTFLDTDFGNEVLRFLNGILNCKITPAGAGKVVFGPQGMTIDLAQIKATAPAGAPDLSGLQAQISALQGQVNAIKYSLQNATITANCNTSDGSIVIVLTLPNFPP